MTTTAPTQSKASAALDAAAVAYARAHRALQRATPPPYILRTPEISARIEAKRLALVRAEGRLNVAARAFGRGRLRSRRGKVTP